MKDDNNMMNNDYDEEERQLVLDFENTILKGGNQFFDEDEMEVIIDYYFEVNDLEPLQRAVEYAEELYPDSTTVRLRRAHLMIAHEQFDSALHIIKQLRRKEPDNTDVAYSLGVAYGAVGEHRKAIELYHEAAADGWMLGRVYANIAEEYYAMQEYDEAIRYYQLALDTDTYDTATLYNYCDAASLAHRLEDAQAYFKSFVGEHPYSYEGWHCLGYIYRAMGLLERAADAYEYAIAIDKNRIAAYTDLALTQEDMGNVGDAVTTLLRACDAGANRSEVYRQIAFVYVRSDNDDMAILYFRKAVEANPDDPVSLASLALAYALIGESALAFPILKKALNLAPENAEVLNAAAITYDTVDNYEMACDFFERLMLNEDCTEPMCRRYVHFLYIHKAYDTLIQFGTESLEIYPDDPYYSTYLAAAYFYTNRYNRASRMLPHADPALLQDICPELCEHPRLGPLVPPNKND